MLTGIGGVVVGLIIVNNFRPLFAKIVPISTQIVRTCVRFRGSSYEDKVVLIRGLWGGRLDTSRVE